MSMRRYGLYLLLAALFVGIAYVMTLLYAITRQSAPLKLWMWDVDTACIHLAETSGHQIAMTSVPKSDETPCRPILAPQPPK